jgi:hypothetical protein
MSYKTRILTPSEKIIPFSTLKKVSDRIKLVAGTENLWEKIEIYDGHDILLATLEYAAVSPDSSGDATLKGLGKSIQDKYPVNARQWLTNYFTTVKSIYTFNIFPDRMNKNNWLILGGIQNFLKDSLGGIIQADNEGYYNEAGLYILWQMYEGATGNATAASLDENGEWVPYSYSLRLDDKKAVDLFKQGIAPKRGFFSRVFGI